MDSEKQKEIEKEIHYLHLKMLKDLKMQKH
jgi:hypothetical protein